jgi:hypothetical protein
MTAAESEGIFVCRCGVCRRKSKLPGARTHQRQSPIVGLLHVYNDNRLLTLDLGSTVTINGEPYCDDGFYASIERLTKVDSSNHRRETAWARSQGQPPPRRKRPEDLRWRPGIDIKGRWVGAQLTEECPRGHRINVDRDKLRQIVEQAQPGQTLYLE